MINKKIIIKDIIVYLIIIMCVLTTITNFYIIFDKKMEPECQIKYYRRVYISEYDYDIDKAIIELKQLFNTQHFYIEKGMDEELLGKSIPIIRLVIMRKGLKQTEPEKYILGYAHELMHIQGMTGNETWVTYHTIIKLYESDNDYFKLLAWNEAVNIMAGSCVDTAYDCSGQLVKYFEREQ